MYDDISERLRLNLSRVDNLIEIYQTHLVPDDAGKPKVTETDVLRAAVVMLHAAMEDFLRSLLVWKLPLAAAERLNDVPLYDAEPRRTASKFSLGALAAHRDLTVAELIEKSVVSHLEAFQSFNNATDVAAALENCGLQKQDVDLAMLERMTARRHAIVHKADRRPMKRKPRQHKVSAIRTEEVQGYVGAVEGLRDAVSTQLGGSEV